MEVDPPTKDDAQPTVPVCFGHCEVDGPVTGFTPDSMDVDALPASSELVEEDRRAAVGVSRVRSPPRTIYRIPPDRSWVLASDERVGRPPELRHWKDGPEVVRQRPGIDVDELKSLSLVDTAVSEKCGHYCRRTKHPCPRARRTPASWLQAVYPWRSEVQSSNEAHFPSPPAVLAARASSATPSAPVLLRQGQHSAEGVQELRLSHKPLRSRRALLNDLFLLAPSCPIRTLCIKGPALIVKAIRAYEVLKSDPHRQLVHANSPVDVHAPAIVDGLFAAVGSLPALWVRVVSVLCYLVADPPCAAEAFMRGLDLDALARRLCAACPTLRTVVVLLSGVRGRANERVQLGPQCTEFELYADRMGNPGHRGTEAVGDEISAEPCDVEREAGEVSSEGAVQDELRSSRG
ncbi:uncharacterized protein BXZ73DRAFT_100184 [Epithele typhae]|uniref:uncharacterized protein n=1 Tax=Epithele typhae TaxID=378194 RepID=UPI002007F8D3|nr:uncharacterized protein BXZ73DRAFT_100184 [Epithele typhae]KAH9936762.1 hypothetical protein BXZ73DRAFT_100184 [Epithele typhae]